MDEDKKVRLNLGSGYRPIAGYVNIDNRGVVEPDMVCDVTEGLPFADGSVDEITAIDFLEHVPMDKTTYVIEEIHRTLRPRGLFTSVTPSTDGRGAFQDPTHLSFWNANSWFYYIDDDYRKQIGTSAKFEGRVYDVLTDDKFNIIHTRAYLRAIK